MDNTIYLKIKKMLDYLYLDNLSDEYFQGLKTNYVKNMLLNKIQLLEKNIVEAAKSNTNLQNDFSQMQNYIKLRNAIHFFSSSDQSEIAEKKEFLSSWQEKKKNIIDTLNKHNKHLNSLNNTSISRNSTKIQQLEQELLEGNTNYAKLKELFELELTAKRTKLEELEFDTKMLDKKIKNQISKIIDEEFFEMLYVDPSTAMYGFVFGEDADKIKPVKIYPNGKSEYNTESILNELNPRLEIINIISHYQNENKSKNSGDKTPNTPSLHKK